jgi:hypothetical protein
VQITSAFPGLTGAAASAQTANNIVISKKSSTTSAASTQSSGLSSSSDSSGESQAVKDFLDYMKKPVAERMRDTWLKAHGLTEKDLDAMPGDERDAIEKQMAADIKSQMQQQAQAKATKQTSSAAALTTLLTNSM